ncbi:MAG TPA: hypothetical protein VKT81_15265 [Bryobacteraceae bacterium]|nr:hypothetical protein [Bryobacteraceae bacterium]
MFRLSFLLSAFLLFALLAPVAAAQDFFLDSTNLEFDPQAGSSPDPQTDVLHNLLGSSIHIQLQAKTQSGGSWLNASISPNPVAGNDIATITITVNSARLQAGSYQGSITVSDGTTKVTISVTLNVAGVVISAPTSKSISLVQGAMGGVTIHVTGGPANLNVSSTVPWISSQGSAQAPGDVAVTVDATSLAPGPHIGGVSLQCAAGGSPCLPVFVSISVSVSAPTFLKANQGSLTFQAFQGRGDPPAESLQIVTNDGTPLSVALAANSSWLSVSGSSSTASSRPLVLTVNVSAAQLQPGANNGTVTATASNGSPAIVIQVTATLSPFTINVTPASPIAVAVASGKTQSVSLLAGTADQAPAVLATATTTNDGHPWLTAPATINAPANFNITVDASQLPPGSYTGTLTLTCTNATCDPLKVTVNATVGAGTLAPQVNAVVGGGLSVPPVNDLSGNGLFSIFGTGFADASVSRNVVGSDLTNNMLPTNLANTCVEGGNQRWSLIYVSAGQINALANPLLTTGTIPVSVIRNCGQANEVKSAPMNVTIAAVTPQFLFVVQNPNGKNEIVAVEASTGAKVGPAGLIPGVTFTPAKAGDIITAYGVGWGVTTPAAVVGSLPAHGADITGDHTLTVGGKTAKVSYAGLCPGFAGLYQINFTVPSGLSAGNQPIVLTIDKVSTPAGAFLAVK